MKMEVPLLKDVPTQKGDVLNFQSSFIPQVTDPVPANNKCPATSTIYSGKLII